MLEAIAWHGHSCFSINGSPQILIDPFSLIYEGQPPDLILISHEHYDHCSPADIAKIADDHTKIIASRTAADNLRDLNLDITVLRPWQTINFGRTSIRAVPAYTYSGDHPARRDDLGFVISQQYTDIYYAGDSDFIPELRNLRCDIAILPAATHPESAVDFARQLHPRYVIPAKPNSRLQMQAFERALTGLTELVKLPKSTNPAPLFARR